MRCTGLNHITLAVSDIAQSLDFYCNILGAQLRSRWAAGAYLEIGPLWLCLSQSAPDTDIDVHTDDSHIALSCAPADYPALAARIGHHAKIWKDNRSEGASVYFTDPDGHRLELHQGDLASRLAHYLAHPEKGVEVFENEP